MTNLHLEVPERRPDGTYHPERCPHGIRYPHECDQCLEEVSLGEAKAWLDRELKTRAAIEALEAALRLLEDLPSGIDPDPDPKEQSPSDLIWHVGGLAAAEIKRAIVLLRRDS